MAIALQQSSSSISKPTHQSSPYSRHAYLIGLPIKHSISPTLHHTLYASINRNWGQIVRESKDLPGHLKLLRDDPKCLGSGVTMPYKVSVIPLLDDLTPEAQAIGAVNTIFFRPDPQAPGGTRFVGTNTDCIGIRDAFLTNIPNPSVYRGKPGLVVGGGGTCRAAIYALNIFLGSSPIYIINRDDAEVTSVMTECSTRGMSPNELIHVSSVEQARELEAPGGIVSAIPDFTPATPAERNVRDILIAFLSSKAKGALLEMCYHPSPRTQISKLAEEKGWQVMLGTEALIGQGLEQAKLWTGIEITDSLKDEVRRVIGEVLSGEMEPV